LFEGWENTKAATKALFQVFSPAPLPTRISGKTNQVPVVIAVELRRREKRDPARTTPATLGRKHYAG